MAAIPLPPKLAEGEAIRKQATPEQSTKGWWSIHGISGSLAGVLSALDSSEKVPEHWKIALRADLTARCGSEFNFVWLDAHYVIHGGKGTLHVTIDAEKKLL